jgi:hypothetical protein
LIWIALGAALLALFVWLGRNPQAGGRGQWRAASSVIAVALLVAGAAAALRGSWAIAVVLLLASVALATLSRRPPRLTPGASRLSEADARRLLGVGPDAEAEEIQAAYVRLMRKVHPDVGGAEGLAAQLNAARERLLRDR